MEHQHTKPADRVKRTEGHEGPKNHIVGFAISIFLTILAFVAVANIETLDRTFVLMLLVAMAIVQVVVQLAFWMHMKDKGHFFPVLFLATGCFIVFTAVIMSQYWVWW
jgi:cytochrome c oxidase subunit 4